MQTFTISINSNTALKTLRELEEQHLISIVEKNDMDSPAIPGRELSLIQFKKWINDAEKTSTVSFEEAKSIWAEKKKQLKKITR